MAAASGESEEVKLNSEVCVTLGGLSLDFSGNNDK